MGFFMKEKNLKVLLTVVIVILILLIVGLVGYNLLKNTMTMSKIEKKLRQLKHRFKLFLYYDKCNNW